MNKLYILVHYTVSSLYKCINAFDPLVIDVPYYYKILTGKPGVGCMGSLLFSQFFGESETPIKNKVHFLKNDLKCPAYDRYLKNSTNVMI